MHLLRNPLHGAGAYAELAGNLVNAFTCAQLPLDALAAEEWRAAAFEKATYAGVVYILTRCAYGEA